MSQDSYKNGLSDNTYLTLRTEQSIYLLLARIQYSVIAHRLREQIQSSNRRNGLDIIPILRKGYRKYVIIRLEVKL